MEIYILMWKQKSSHFVSQMMRQLKMPRHSWNCEGTQANTQTQMTSESIKKFIIWSNLPWMPYCEVVISNSSLTTTIVTVFCILCEKLIVFFQGGFDHKNQKYVFGFYINALLAHNFCESYVESTLYVE